MSKSYPTATSFLFSIWRCKAHIATAKETGTQNCSACFGVIPALKNNALNTFCTKVAVNQQQWVSSYTIKSLILLFGNVQLYFYNAWMEYANMAMSNFWCSFYDNKRKENCSVDGKVKKNLRKSPRLSERIIHWTTQPRSSQTFAWKKAAAKSIQRYFFVLRHKQKILSKTYPFFRITFERPTSMACLYSYVCMYVEEHEMKFNLLMLTLLHSEHGEWKSRLTRADAWSSLYGLQICKT